MRLGFAVKVLGRPQLKSYDSRRWQNSPHLSVSLAYVRDILLYLDEIDVRMYRMQSDLAPYVTHPDLPQFHNQLAECEAELTHVGELAREKDIRLSFHAHPYTVLNAVDEDVVQRSMQAVDVLARILDGMGLDGRAVVVIHVGGVYGDREASIERFMARYEMASEPARRRLVLENDEERYGVADMMRIHERTGIRLVLDRLHFLLNDPEQMSVREALDICLNTWPQEIVPKIHYSSPRTELKIVPEKAADGDAEVERLRTAPWRNHSDYINPFEFIDFLRAAQGCRGFDIMIEAKAKDRAVLRLREDVAWYASALEAHFELN